MNDLYENSTRFSQVRVLDHPEINESLAAAHAALDSAWQADPDWLYGYEFVRPFAIETLKKQQAEWDRCIGPSRGYWPGSKTPPHYILGILVFLACTPLICVAPLYLGLRGSECLGIPAAWISGIAYVLYRRHQRFSAFIRDLPPRPSAADVPLANHSPTAGWLERVSLSPMDWPARIAHRPDIWRPTQGLPGELAVLRKLHVLANPLKGGRDLFLVLHGLPLARSLDADLLVLSRYGLRLLEIKYWQGLVRWQAGRLTHMNIYYGPGGVLQQRERREGDPFQQLRDELGLLRRGPAAANPDCVRGALVFAHPDCELDLDGSIGDAAVLRPDEIVDWLRDSQGEPLLKPTEIFELADRLIEHGRRLMGNPVQRGADPGPWARERMARWKAEGSQHLSQLSDYIGKTAPRLSEEYQRLYRQRQEMF